MYFTRIHSCSLINKHKLVPLRPGGKRIDRGHQVKLSAPKLLLMWENDPNAEKIAFHRFLVEVPPHVTKLTSLFIHLSFI